VDTITRVREDLIKNCVDQLTKFLNIPKEDQIYGKSDHIKYFSTMDVEALDIEKDEQLFTIYLRKIFGHPIITFDSVEVHEKLRGKGILTEFMKQAIDLIREKAIFITEIKFVNLITDEIKGWMAEYGIPMGFVEEESLYGSDNYSLKIDRSVQSGEET
jgi:predicted GNAT family acetyltransferase